MLVGHISSQYHLDLAKAHKMWFVPPIGDLGRVAPTLFNAN